MRSLLFYTVVSFCLSFNLSINFNLNLAPGITEARAAFEQVFSDACSETPFALPPPGVQVLGVRLVDGHLAVNVSCAILAYGGTAYEQELVALLLETAATIPGVEWFTLYINGFLHPLTEGTELKKAELKTPIPQTSKAPTPQTSCVQ